jgi:hypothetical protein
VLEEYTIEDRPSVLRFLCTKGLSLNDIHKDLFPVCGGKYLSSKVFQNWVAKVTLMTKR